MICPCGENMRTNGERNGNQRWRCNECGHSETEGPIMTGYDVIEGGDVLTASFDETVRLHGFTDVHHGANEHDWDKFDAAIEMVKNDPQARWFGNGDLIELIPSNYGISQRGQKTNPEDQMMTIVDRLMPISEKCLFLRPGNHELRLYNKVDLEVTTLMAHRLGVPLFRLPGYTVINVNGKEWKMASGHGRSGAKNGDLELHKMKEVYSEADIFYLGHDHKLYADPKPSLKVEDGKEKLRNQWFVRGGSFLRYADYARYSIYGIQKIGWVEMEFTEETITCKIH